MVRALAASAGPGVGFVLGLKLGWEGRIVPFVVVEWVGRAILDWEVPPKPECKNMTKTIRELHSLLWFSD